MLNDNSSNDYFAESSLNNYVKLGSKAVDHNRLDWHKFSKIEKIKPFASSLPEVLGSKI